MQNITAIAIPARDEAERIAACLEALDNQAGAQANHIVLLANNCTDATAAIARAVTLRPGTALHVIEATLPPAQANAGHARRLAMQHASALAGPSGVLLTTDADGRVDQDWLAGNLTALAAGVDAVAGWVELDPIEWSQIPAILHEDDARECAYDLLCDRLHARLDPDPADPLPRHTQHSGASIAVTVDAFTRCGGVPDVACGEDRALIAALRRIDARIRHAPEVRVTVSGRIDGRCIGGMADTIRRRMAAPDPFLDDRLEPAEDCARRAIWRRRVRSAFATGENVTEYAILLGLPPSRLRALLGAGFGVAWESVEAESPLLRRRRVPASEVAAQSSAAELILAALDPDDRSDNLAFALQSPV